VLPPSIVARVSVEKGSTFGWDRWVGPTEAIIGMSTFGTSAPLKVLQDKFGFTVEHIVAAARAQLGLDHDADTPGVTLETSETIER
jgi:transketolase